MRHETRIFQEREGAVMSVPWFIPSLLHAVYVDPAFQKQLETIDAGNLNSAVLDATLNQALAKKPNDAEILGFLIFLILDKWDIGCMDLAEYRSTRFQ